MSRKLTIALAAALIFASAGPGVIAQDQTRPDPFWQARGDGPLFPGAPFILFVADPLGNPMLLIDAGFVPEFGDQDLVLPIPPMRGLDLRLQSGDRVVRITRDPPDRVPAQRPSPDPVQPRGDVQLRRFPTHLIQPPGATAFTQGGTLTGGDMGYGFGRFGTPPPDPGRSVLGRNVPGIERLLHTLDLEDYTVDGTTSLGNLPGGLGASDTPYTAGTRAGDGDRGGRQEANAAPPTGPTQPRSGVPADPFPTDLTQPADGAPFTQGGELGNSGMGYTFGCFGDPPTRDDGLGGLWREWPGFVRIPPPTHDPSLGQGPAVFVFLPGGHTFTAAY